MSEKTLLPASVEVRPSIWRRATPQQRRELELLMQEMGRSGQYRLEVEAPEGWGMRLGLTPESMIVALVDTEGMAFATRSIPLEPLRGSIRAYLTLIARMGDAISGHAMVHLEALDQARRAAHNEASQRIQEDLEGLLQVDLETARRLFTVLCLVYDTPVR